MKKILIRLVGSLCILAALAVMFFPTLVRIDGVKAKHMVAARNMVLDDLGYRYSRLMSYYEFCEKTDDDGLKDDLKANDLPSRKSEIEECFSQACSLLKELINKDISLVEIARISIEAPKYIEQTNNLLTTDRCINILFGPMTELLPGPAEESINLVQDVVDVAHDYKPAFTIALTFIIFMLAFGFACAVTHMLNRPRFLKYIFFLFLLTFVVGITITVPMISDAVLDGLPTVPTEAEDLRAQVTAMPYFALFLAMVPIVLDIIFERKKKVKKNEGD